MDRVIFKTNRFLAALVDGFFMLLITIGFCIAPALTFFRELADGRFIASDMVWLILSLIGSFFLWILYLAIPALFLKNATIGMKINHLTFVSTKDDEPRFSKLLFREALVVACLVLSLGLSIYSDIFAFICNEEPKSFSDIFTSIKVVPNNGY